MFTFGPLRVFSGFTWNMLFVSLLNTAIINVRETRLLSYHFTTCNSYSLYIPNTHVETPKVNPGFSWGQVLVIISLGHIGTICLSTVNLSVQTLCYSYLLTIVYES